MAASATLSDYFRVLLATRYNNSEYLDIVANATDLRVILMQSGFTFRPETMPYKYADVSGYELPTLNGYTAGGISLTMSQDYLDTTIHRYRLMYTTAQWTASGGNIGPTPGAIIYSAQDLEPGGTPSVNHIIGYVNFGGDQTQLNGGVLSVPIEIDI